MEAETFLKKAEEDLASAASDFENERYNACARSLYYAAFHAAIAALLAADIRPQARWEHEFVHSQFAGMLVYRRKLYPSAFGPFLTSAFNTRVKADYSGVLLREGDVRQSLEQVRRLVEQVKERIDGRR